MEQQIKRYTPVVFKVGRGEFRGKVQSVGEGRAVVKRTEDGKIFTRAISLLRVE